MARQPVTANKKAAALGALAAKMKAKQPATPEPELAQAPAKPAKAGSFQLPVYLTTAQFGHVIIALGMYEGSLEKSDLAHSRQRALEVAETRKMVEQATMPYRDSDR